MRITIHQPEHLPWLGFFDKAKQVDLLVLLDNVQFRKNYFQNRNKIRTPEGSTWITLPVHRPLLKPIGEIRVVKDSPVMEHYLNLIRDHYHYAPYYESTVHRIEKILLSGCDRLVELNEQLLRLVFDVLEMRTQIARASGLDCPPSMGASEMLLNICRSMGARLYLSGISGREYLDLEAFHRHGIEVEFQEFHHPIYPQMYPGFVPRISVLEALFLFGPTANRLLQASWAERMETVFA